MDANLKFSQQQGMYKIKTVSNVYVNEEQDRRYSGSTVDGQPHGRGLMFYDDGKIVSGDW